MAWVLSVFSVAAFIAAGIFAALATVGLRRRQSGAWAFTALMTVGMVWAALYGVQLGFRTLPQQLPFQAAALATSSLIPPVLLYFAFRYAGRPERFTRRVGAAAVCESLAFVALCLTNPVHGLVWTAATLETASVSPVVDLTFGVGYYVHIVFAYAVVALSLWSMLSVYFGSTDVYRRQSALLLAGTTPAFVAHVVYTLGLSPVPGLDLTPFALSFTGVTYGLALFHFDLLERTPVAHQRAVELTGDGLLVVDSAGVVVDCNRIARQVYDVEVGATNVASVLGVPEESLLDLTGATTSDVVDGTTRTYDLYVSELTGESGLFAGYAVVLRDVTDREAYERRLEVANRVLRHNLRNDMNVVQGNADLLVEMATSTDQRAAAATIRSKATHLVELSRKARQITHLRAGGDADATAVAVRPILDDAAARFREAYPEAALSVDCPDEARAGVLSERALSVALWNLLDNAGAHNEPSSLTVDVAVTTADGATRVRVRDDGAGLPPVERAVLRERSETPVEHSNGLGLWLTYWITESSGGEVELGPSDAEGTEISLVFPARPSSEASTAADGDGASEPATATGA